MRCKWFFRNERRENVTETSEFKGACKRSACTRTVFKPVREGYFINTSRKGINLFLGIFIKIIITVSWKIVVLLLLTKPMDLIPLEEKNTGKEY